MRVVPLGVLIAAIAVAASPANAEDALRATIPACAVEVVHADRLACYDAAAQAAGLIGAAPAVVPASASGKWMVQRRQNPLDDTETVTAALLAEEGKSRAGEPVTLVARCLSDKTDVYVAWGDFLGDDSFGLTSAEWKRVTLRIGDGVAVEQQWSISTDTRATFAPAWAGDLLKEMAGSTSLLVQTTPAGASPVTAVFDTTGLREALAPLADACGWRLD